MIPDLCDILLWTVLALALAAVLAIPISAKYAGIHAALGIGQRTACLVTILALSVFSGLIWCYVTADFSVTNVALNVSRDQPLAYRIAAVWSNHEGSMLLWLTLLCVGGGCISALKSWTESAQAWSLWLHLAMIVLFATFVVILANPFARFWPLPTDGLGINPLLQNPNLLVHPPLLYAGLVGSALMLSLAWGAVRGDMPLELWVRRIQAWVRGIWVCLTGGIALGSLWAYTELGWGGWWFWDPIENVSLLPWLVVTALLHALGAAQRNPRFEGISVWLATLAFPLSTLGTVLTRSGIVTSLHAFAQDTTRGQGLGLILLMICGLLAVAGWGRRRVPSLYQWRWTGDQGIALHVGFMMGGMVIVALGTVAPVIATWIGLRVDVTPQFYGVTFVPIMLIMTAILGVTISDRWSSSRFIPWVAILTLIIIAGSLLYTRIITALVYGLALWVAGHSLVAWYQQRRRPWAMMIGHLGLAVAMIGMAAQSAGQREYVALLKPSEHVSVKGYDICLQDVVTAAGPNYRIVRGHLEVRDASSRFLLTPEQWFFPTHAAYTTETAIHHGFAGDLYAALGQQRDQRWELRLYWNPLMWCIWLGAALLCLAGVIALLRGRRPHAYSKRASISD